MAKKKADTPKILRWELSTLHPAFVDVSDKSLFQPARDGSIVGALSRFIAYNQEPLNFLDIKAEIVNDGYKHKLQLSAARNVGVIPLKDPTNGWYNIMLTVKGNYDENIPDLISRVSSQTRPEFHRTLVLPAKPTLTPPLFIECARYIKQYREADLGKWRKFSVETRQEAQPSAGTRWDEYAQRAITHPAQRLKFNNRRNTLSPWHAERECLDKVLQIAIAELTAPGLSPNMRAQYAALLSKYNLNKDTHSNLEKPAPVALSPRDTQRIKALKVTANNIITDQVSSSTAWRIDVAELFERYVQHIFKEAARGTLWSAHCNPHLAVKGPRPPWAPAYLEPDLVMRNKDYAFVIDAKYKSHVMNWAATSDELKDTFRHDMHQILCYRSLLGQKVPAVALVYPAHRFSCRNLTVEDCTINIIGLPVDAGEAYAHLREITQLFLL